MYVAVTIVCFVNVLVNRSSIYMRAPDIQTGFNFVLGNLDFPIMLERLV